MIEQYVSALLNMKSSIKALSVPTLSLDQTLELLPLLTSPAHKMLPAQSWCATQNKEKEQERAPTIP